MAQFRSQAAAAKRRVAVPRVMTDDGWVLPAGATGAKASGRTGEEGADVSSTLCARATDVLQRRVVKTLVAQAVWMWRADVEAKAVAAGSREPVREVHSGGAKGRRRRRCEDVNAARFCCSM